MNNGKFYFGFILFKTLTFIFLSAFTFTTSALAWGVNKELINSRQFNVSLTGKVLKKNSVSYCLSISPSAIEFSEDEISLEFEAALNLWLNALKNFDGQTKLIEHRTCQEKVDIVVVLGEKTPDDISNGAFTSVILGKQKSDDYILLKIDTDYIWNETRNLSGNPNGQYSWHTLDKVTKLKNKSMGSLLYRISIANPMSIDQFAQEQSVPVVSLFWTTYRVFIHELGHGFGLCDTNKSLIDSQCSETLRSQNSQPESVMKTSNFFYLTEDDLNGLFSLRKYIQKMTPQGH